MGIAKGTIMNRNLVIGLFIFALLIYTPLDAEEVKSTSSYSKGNPIRYAEEATGLSFQAKVEPIPGGEIDWTRGVVYAVGIGKARADFQGRQAEAMAKRGAYIVAARNAALVLAGIRVGPGGRFENVRNGWIRANVTLTGFREIDATYNPATRTATARLELPLYGIRGAVTVLGLKEKNIQRRWAWPKETVSKTAYDVIVIDVRGMAYTPVVLPRLVTAEGQCVFDASEILANTKDVKPPARFVTLKRKIKIPATATRHARRCLTIKAQRISSDGAIVLDQENLRSLASAANAQSALKKGRVVIVTDE